MLATEADRASRNRQGRVGEGPYMEGVDSGQPPFCNFVSQGFESRQNPRRMWAQWPVFQGHLSLGRPRSA